MNEVEPESGPCEVCESWDKPTSYNGETNGFDCEACREIVAVHAACGTAFYTLDDKVCDHCGQP